MDWYSKGKVGRVSPPSELHSSGTARAASVPDIAMSATASTDRFL